MKIKAFIPVRGGSKTIPHKNTKSIGGSPLFHWTACAASKAQNIHKVVIATDSQQIADAASGLSSSKIEIFFRDPNNCTDTASTESAMLEYANKYNDFTHMMLIQATSPLIESKHLDEAIDLYVKSKADSLIALVRQIKFVWEKKPDGTVVPTNYNPLKRQRRQEFDGILTEPGAFYITNREGLLSTKCRVNGKIIGYELPEECYFDLDTMFDWEIVESIFRIRQKSSQQLM